MAGPSLELIAAVAANGVIGKGGQLAWHLPDDLRHFKQLTMGHPILMGRRTYESIGKPLPGRLNIVVTHREDFAAPGCTVAHSMDEAYRAAGDAPEVSIIGGSAIFEEALPGADTVYLTEVDADVEGDVFFPSFDRSRFRETELERHSADERHAYPFRILRLDRK